MTRNVVLVVLDTVRKDTFDEYAPRLRTRADTSIEGCRAASSWSVPSHTSMFTGELPSEHGIHAESFDKGFSFGSLDAADTFLGSLPDHRTIGLSANTYVNAAFDFDALFDEFHDFSIGSHSDAVLFPDGLNVQQYMSDLGMQGDPKRYLKYLRACLRHDRPAKSLANGVWGKALGPIYDRLPLPEFADDGASAISRTAVERAGDAEEPFFMFANLMDAHTPLRPLLQYDRSLYSASPGWRSTELDKWELNKDGLATPEYARNYRELYAAAVDYLDRRMTEMIDDVRAAADGETTFVIVSDHGHNLGYAADDDLFHHTSSMTEGVMHTPCEVVGAPEGSPETVEKLFSQLRLGDLLVALADDEPVSEELFDERVPAETIGLLGTDDGTWGREFSDEEYAHWNRMMRCVYDQGGERKWLWNSLGDRHEYALDPDRPCWQERVDADADIPEAALDQFPVPLEEYKREAAADEQDLAFDDDVGSRLKDLGYL